MISSLYTGATGLTAHSAGMQVVGNNLANVNTVGFKQTMMLYQDLISSTVSSRSNGVTNLSQKGLGVSIGENRRIFNQGGFEPGNSVTDMGIQGRGFFGVSKGGVTNYTRAGNFRFNDNGELKTQEQWDVLGRPIVNGKVSNAVEPVKIDFSPTGSGVGYMKGKPTTSLTAISQLGGLVDATENKDNPYFAMATRWDGTKKPPIGSGQYSYAEPIEIFDDNGKARAATVFYDFAGEKNGHKVMEYVIAMDPADDASGKAGTKAAGLLMAGTVSFSASGQLENMTAFTPPSSGNSADLSGWTAAPLQDGVPVFTANYTNAGTQQVTFDVGLKLAGAGPYASAADVSADPGALYGAAKDSVRSARATTAYGTSAGSVNQNNDGYPEGTLRTLQVTDEGLIVGQYSNGQNADLFQISLFRFTSQDGLRAEGGNRFAATKDSGAAEEGLPTTENFGAIQSKQLEQSNVDYAREFTTMIITQRGFQMNSKVITTSDTMLQKALEIKR